jgi:hypothetical protein
MTQTHSRTVTITPASNEHFTFQKIINQAVELATCSVLDDCRNDIEVTTNRNEETGVVTIEATITVNKEPKL